MDAPALSSGSDTMGPSPSLSQWLPLLWQRAIVPGASSSPTGSHPQPLRWSMILLLILIPGALLYPSLSFPLFEPDETRYAQIPREMLERGSLVVPTLQGEPYLDKPPLFYWAVMGSYRLFGVNIAAARIVPALSVHLCVILVYLFGRKWVGERAAFLGALLLGLSPGFLNMGRLLLLDGLLTLWTTMAIFSAFLALFRSHLHWGWWSFSAVCCGLGTLTKGPVTAILLVPPLLLYGWLMKGHNNGLCRPSKRAIAAYLLILLAIPLPWFVAMCIQSPEFARHFLWDHNIVRFVAPFDHQRGVWFYLPILLAGLLPATLWTVPFARFLLSGNNGSAGLRSPELGFLLMAGSWCLLFFTVSGCKLPTYILPAFPPLALALGYVLVVTGRSTTRRAWLTVGCCFGVLLVSHHLLIPWYASHRSPVRNEGILRQYCANPDQPVICYPRPSNAVAYLVQRSDLRNYRSKEIEELRWIVRQHPCTVILCTHRHSLQGLRELLPPEVEITETVHFGLEDVPLVPQRYQKAMKKLMGETALGLCDLAVVRMKWQQVGMSNRRR